MRPTTRRTRRAASRFSSARQLIPACAWRAASGGSPSARGPALRRAGSSITHWRPRRGWSSASASSPPSATISASPRSTPTRRSSRRRRSPPRAFPSRRPSLGPRSASRLRSRDSNCRRSSFSPSPRGTDKKAAVNLQALEQNARLLEGVLDDFGVRGEIINVRPGPVVTLYELEPAPGIKSARVIGLADDIARSMSAIACRVAVDPGQATPSASSCPTPGARRSICASCWPRRISSDQDQARPLPRQDDRRRAGDRRSRPHAASARRRHHRLGQVGRRSTP